MRTTNKQTNLENVNFHLVLFITHVTYEGRGYD